MTSKGPHSTGTSEVFSTQGLAGCRKSKLYRFDSDSGEWKERGAGQTRLLQSNENSKIRLLMRQEKTLKIRANHFGEYPHPLILRTDLL